MSKVIIHATVTLDGFLATPDGGVDWMSGYPTEEADFTLNSAVMDTIGAVVGGANRTQSIEEGEQPYGGTLKVPVYLMTHTPHAPIEHDGTRYTFVVDDIAEAVRAAKQAAGDSNVSLLGGSIARQCLMLGLVDELQLHIAPVLLGEGISLFSGLGRRIDLERIETEAFAGETHMRYRVIR